MQKSKPFVGYSVETPKGGTLTITGYFAHRRDRRYTCECSICSKDSELWPDGSITCIRSQVVDRGVIPCGCSPHTQWKEWQWEILVKRQAKNLGYEFLGFLNGFSGCHSYLSLECNKHGRWDTGRMSNFLDGHACPLCGIEVSAESLLIPDSVYIEKAMSGETYKKGTILIPDSNRSKSWTMICPVCAVDDVSVFGIGPSSFKMSRKSVKRGLTPCRCAPNYRMTIAELEHKASSVASANGYELDGWYFPELKRNTTAMLAVRCKDHGVFRISYANLVYHERRCPSCSVTGFKSAIDGYVYALKSDCGAYMKVGISNKPEIRIPQLSRATPFSFTVDGVFQTSGVNAQDTEKAAHLEFMSAGLSGFDGCTEWLRYDPAIVQYVEQRAM